MWCASPVEQARRAYILLGDPAARLALAPRTQSPWQTLARHLAGQ